MDVLDMSILKKTGIVDAYQGISRQISILLILLIFRLF